METIKFKKAQLASYEVITQPGKYSLQVANDVTDKNRVTNEDGSAPRYIVGFKAIAEDKLAQVREAFKGANGETLDEIEIDGTNGCFMTGNLWDSTGVVIPAKGERVDCIVDLVKARDTDEEVLRVISMKVRKSISAPKVDLNTFFENTEVSAPAEGTTLTTH